MHLVPVIQYNNTGFNVCLSINIHPLTHTSIKTIPTKGNLQCHR